MSETIIYKRNYRKILPRSNISNDQLLRMSLNKINENKERFLFLFSFIFPQFSFETTNFVTVRFDSLNRLFTRNQTSANGKQPVQILALFACVFVFSVLRPIFVCERISYHIVLFSHSLTRWSLLWSIFSPAQLKYRVLSEKVKKGFFRAIYYNKRE